ncbi:S-adenosylmethionine:tRNA ribosyltransferase-isomerase [Staphylococcus epidermidis]|uniref:S-adenosylmethionine:tRNA ribosyltransferase-isomerase n=1 Tax=Staphylococcus epidermidis TaxID=1282 RepID=UPI0037DA63A3
MGFIRLDVGLGRFRGVSVENMDDEEMDSEYYEMREERGDLLNKRKESGKGVI